jgi:hypothetical protein
MAENEKHSCYSKERQRLLQDKSMPHLRFDYLESNLLIFKELDI